MSRQYFNGKIVVENGRNKLMGRNKADTLDLDLLGINSADELELASQPRIRKYDFASMQVPLAGKKGATGGAPTGIAGDENLLVFPGLHLEYHVLGTQTILAPTMAATGLDLNSQDQTANDGAEFCPGILASSPHAFTVGTDPAFYCKAKFSIADVSGTDDCAFGFRKLEAYQANVDDYDEMACLNVISGNVNIETILNGAATVTTDTTENWADTETHTLEVRVSAAGVVTYKFDGGAPTTVAAFTFDDAEVLVPFFYMLNHTDLAGAIVLQELEMGYL